MLLYLLEIIGISLLGLSLLLFSYKPMGVIDNKILDNNFIKFTKYLLDKKYVQTNDEQNGFEVNSDSNGNLEFGDSTQIEQGFYKFGRLILDNKDTTIFKKIDGLNGICLPNQKVNKDICEGGIITNDDLNKLYNEGGFSSEKNGYIPVFKGSENNSDGKGTILRIYKVSGTDNLYKISLLKINKKANNYTYKILSSFYY